MTQEGLTLEECIAYLHLIVQFTGGKVEMPYQFAEAGLPAGHGLAIEFNDDAEVITFEIKARDGQ